MGWKLYFVGFAVLTLVGFASEVVAPAGISFLAIARLFPEGVLLVGLYGYAFGRRIGTPLIWRVVAGLVALSIPLGIAALLNAIATGRWSATPGVTLAVIVILAALTLPSFVAMLRYAGRLAEAPLWMAPAARTKSDGPATSRTTFGQRGKVRS